jgi:hypothetical protein
MKEEISEFLKNLITATKEDKLIWVPESVGKFNCRISKFDIWLHTANKDHSFIKVYDKKRKTEYLGETRPSGEDIMANHLWDKLIKTVQDQAADYNNRMINKLNNELTYVIKEPSSSIGE